MQAKLTRLAKQPGTQVDTTETPEITAAEWDTASRGHFFRSVKRQIIPERKYPIVATMSYNRLMPANAVVRSRVSVEIKDQATEVLEGMGLTVSDAIRIVLTRVAKDRTLPFDLKPNKLTRETMRRTARGEEVHPAADAKDLFEQLGI